MNIFAKRSNAHAEIAMQLGSPSAVRSDQEAEEKGSSRRTVELTPHLAVSVFSIVRSDTSGWRVDGESSRAP